MLIGISINFLAVIIGGIAGSTFGHMMPDKIKQQLILVFGICSFGIGIQGVMAAKFLSVVIFAIAIGTLIGLSIGLGERIQRGAGLLQRGMLQLVKRNAVTTISEDMETQLLTIIVLFCASGTGIYGSLEAGMTGDATILISKAILDGFTSFIFACHLGAIVSMVAIPQAIIHSALALSANAIMPYTTEAMIGDLRACGGLIIIATGFRIMKLKLLPTADMIPAMVLVLPFSWIWANWIAPFL